MLKNNYSTFADSLIWVFGVFVTGNGGEWAFKALSNRGKNEK